MEFKHWIGVILTTTFCLTIIVIGGTYVDRTVKDQNYREPTPQEAAVKAFKDCVDDGVATSAEEGKARVEACSKMTGQPTPVAATPSPSPAAKK